MRQRKLKQWDSSLIHDVEHEKQDTDVTQKTGARIKEAAAMAKMVALVLHCFDVGFDFWMFFSTRGVREAEWKLVRMVLLLLLSFSSCGKTYYYSFVLHLIEWEKEAATTNEGLVWRRRTESIKERGEKGKVSDRRPMPRGGQVVMKLGDMILEISLSDFKSLCWNKQKIDSVFRRLKAAIQNLAFSFCLHRANYYFFKT